MKMSMGTEYTIREYVQSYATDDIKSSAFFLQEVFQGSNNKKMIINQNSLLIKYMNELRTDVVKVSFDESEYRKYLYNPKLLSYDLYGTTELWFLILEINELHSINQFDLRTVNLFGGDIATKLTRILDLEKTVIDYNKSQVSSETK